MYDILKNWIARKKWANFETVAKKLTIYNMGDVITDDEYLELIEFAKEVYEVEE